MGTGILLSHLGFYCLNDYKHDFSNCCKEKRLYSLGSRHRNPSKHGLCLYEKGYESGKLSVRGIISLHNSPCTAGFCYMDTFLRVGEKGGRCKSLYCQFLIFPNSFLLHFFLLSIKVWTPSSKYFFKVSTKLVEVGYCMLIFFKDYFFVPWFCTFFCVRTNLFCNRSCISFHHSIKHYTKMLYSFLSCFE